jgi:hypothetical protein
VLAIVDEEVGLGALRQRVLARVRVRRPLRHRSFLSAAAAGTERRVAFKIKARPYGAVGYSGGGSRDGAATLAPGGGIRAVALRPPG